MAHNWHKHNAFRKYINEEIKKARSMYKVKIPTAGTQTVNTAVEGETIETKMKRVVENREPITDGAPTVYTERKDGVRPELNPRTDKWDLAIEAMDKTSKAAIAKREAKMKIVDDKDSNPEGLTGNKSEGKTGDQSQ